MRRPPDDWTPEKAKKAAEEMDRMFEASPIFEGFLNGKEEYEPITTGTFFPLRPKAEEPPVEQKPRGIWARVRLRIRRALGR